MGSTRSNFHHLLTGIRHSKSDIVSNGSAEQDRILQNDTYMTAQAIQVIVSDIASVKFDTALIHIVKTIDQVHDGRLP